MQVRLKIVVVPSLRSCLWLLSLLGRLLAVGQVVAILTAATSFYTLPVFIGSEKKKKRRQHQPSFPPWAKPKNRSKQKRARASKEPSWLPWKILLLSLPFLFFLKTGIFDQFLSRAHAKVLLQREAQIEDDNFPFQSNRKIL